jgi:ketosteroid isomerase-like protein
MTTDDINQETYMQDPQGRTRFYGIYEGIVKEINDPLKKGRIKVQVTVTGQEVSGWARAVLPITHNANHPDHQEHTAAQIAALLTTTSTSITDSRGDSATVPALTVVAKGGAGTLKHPHKIVVNAIKKWNGSDAKTAMFNDATNTDEHTPHRYVPNKGQRVWIMFVAGLLEEPVWIGVQE